MARRPRFGDTGLLGQRTTPPEQPPTSAERVHLVDAPTHMLFQIGQPPETVWLIGYRLTAKLIFGRSDAAKSFIAHVDLTPYKAAENGVSRHHLEIIQQQGSVFVKDSKSRNGTTLNDKALEPMMLYPIQDGDTLMLGTLQIVIWFVYADAPVLVE